MCEILKNGSEVSTSFISCNSMTIMCIKQRLRLHSVLLNLGPNSKTFFSGYHNYNGEPSVTLQSQRQLTRIFHKLVPWIKFKTPVELNNLVENACCKPWKSSRNVTKMPFRAALGSKSSYVCAGVKASIGTL